MEPLKKGVWSTEFWTMVASVVPMLITALASLGVVAQADAGDLGKDIAAGVLGLGALLVSGWKVTQYIKGRTAVKEAHESAQAKG